MRRSRPALLNALDAFARPLIGLVFPPVCLACGVPLPPGAGEICDACERGIRPACVTDPLFSETRSKLVDGGSVIGLIAAYYFEKEGPLQSLVHQLKYSGMTRIGIELGRRLGDCALTVTAGTSLAGIIPVPLHAIKVRERGYNQCEFIARGMAAVTGLPVERTIISRVRHTDSQTTLSLAEREANVAGAFAVNPAAARRVSGKTFLIVDDVITTGATMRSCAATLSESGSHESIACAVALAL